MSNEPPAPTSAIKPIPRPADAMDDAMTPRLSLHVVGVVRQELRDGGELLYVPGFFDPATADTLFAQLRDEIPWEHVRIRGVPQKLATYWIGPRPYTYSRQTRPPAPWLPTPRAIATAVDAFLFKGTDEAFESVLINYYESGEVKLGFHADDETIIPPNSPIASVSLGARRSFVLRHNATGATRELTLEHGACSSWPARPSASGSTRYLPRAPRGYASTSRSGGAFRLGLSLAESPKEKPMNTMEPADATMAPFFDDDVAMARAVAETALPEPKVRAVVEATFWYHACAGVMGIEGGDSEEKIAGYLARFPDMFEDRHGPMPTLSYSDEARFISETTDIFEDETTRILASIRAYEAEIGIIDLSAVEEYRAWRVEWLTHVARPRLVKVDGKFVVYSFAEAVRREKEHAAR